MLWLVGCIVVVDNVFVRCGEGEYRKKLLKLQFYSN